MFGHADSTLLFTTIPENQRQIEINIAAGDRRRSSVCPLNCCAIYRDNSHVAVPLCSINLLRRLCHPPMRPLVRMRPMHCVLCAKLVEWKSAIDCAYFVFSFYDVRCVCVWELLRGEWKNTRLRRVWNNECEQFRYGILVNSITTSYDIEYVVHISNAIRFDWVSDTNSIYIWDLLSWVH